VGEGGTGESTPAVDIDEVLAPHRLAVLVFIGWVSLLVGAPVMALIAAHAWYVGNAVWFLAVELACVLGIGLVLVRARGDRLGPATFAFLFGFGLVSLLALNGYGPLFGDGMMVVAWLLAAVFFSGRIAWPTLTVVLAVSALGVLGTLGYTTAPWPADDPTFLPRELMTTAVIAIASAFLFHRIFAGLGSAVARESEARRREAEAQAEREASRAALAESQRLESVGRLAGGVAHDVNNALTVLMGGIELLYMDADDAQTLELLDDMRAASEGALATARQLLTFARTGKTQAVRVADASRAMRSLGRNLARLLPETIELVVELEDDLPPVAIATGDLEQLVLNLCLNARDAMPEGGRLHVSARLDVGPEPDNARHVLIEVADEGVGMDETTRAHVFEPFFTTRPEGGGTGLGLSMVHGTVVGVGGTVELTSVLGEGTTVRVRLPLAGEGVHVADVGSSIRGGGEARHLLLVEDDPGVRRTLTRVLRLANFEVTTAESVAESLDRLRAGRFDALLTDGFLADGDASAVIDAFRRTGSDAIVVYSGHLANGPLRDKIEGEGIAFARKPVASDDLLDLLTSQLDGELGSAEKTGTHGATVW